MKPNSPTMFTSIDRRTITSAPFTPFIWLCSVDIKRGEVVYNPLIARIYKPCDMLEEDLAMS